MMISLKCACGKNLSAPVELGGKKGKCPTCGRTFVVPLPNKQIEQRELATSPAGDNASITSRVAVSPSISSKQHLTAEPVVQSASSNQAKIALLKKHNIQCWVDAVLWRFCPLKNLFVGLDLTEERVAFAAQMCNVPTHERIVGVLANFKNQKHPFLLAFGIHETYYRWGNTLLTGRPDWGRVAYPSVHPKYNGLIIIDELYDVENQCLGNILLTLKNVSMHGNPCCSNCQSDEITMEFSEFKFGAIAKELGRGVVAKGAGMIAGAAVGGLVGGIPGLAYGMAAGWASTSTSPQSEAQVLLGKCKDCGCRTVLRELVPSDIWRP